MARAAVFLALAWTVLECCDRIAGAHNRPPNCRRARQLTYVGLDPMAGEYRVRMIYDCGGEHAG